MVFPGRKSKVSVPSLKTFFFFLIWIFSVLKKMVGDLFWFCFKCFGMYVLDKKNVLHFLRGFV